MNSFISWIGGKNYLKKEIVKRFPNEFNRYVEVFGGAGWVLFYKDKHANEEIYNDFNSDLVNLFRCLKYHKDELQRELQYSLNSRELFFDMREQYNIRGLTDIQRAARFFMIIKISYGTDLRSFGCVKKNINVMIEYLDGIKERLSKVVIENNDFERILKTYDRKETLFYLDPPYFKTEKYYQVEFKEEDHNRLRNTLGNIKGKFILSYNDCDFVRDLYKDYCIQEIKRSHNLVNRYKDKDNKYCELIIKNY